MASKLTMLFWVVTLCGLVGRHQCFCFHCHTVSIFRAEDGDGVEMETLVSTSESTRRHNPEHHHQEVECVVLVYSCRVACESQQKSNRLLKGEV
jgi:hypothetical protein